MTEGRKVFENAEESIKWVSTSDGFERSKNGAGIKDQARGPSARLHPHPFYFFQEGISDFFFFCCCSNPTNRSDRPNETICSGGGGRPAPTSPRH